jgi:hypothetical protein
MTDEISDLEATENKLKQDVQAGYNLSCLI